MQTGYYSAMGLLAIAIHLIINANRRIRLGRDVSKINRYYNLYLISVFIYYVTDVCWGAIASIGNTPVLYVDTIAYYIAMASSVVFWCGYVIEYLNLHGPLAKALRIFGVLFWVGDFIALFLNHFIPIFFWFDETGTYHASIVRYVALGVQVVMFTIIAILSFAVAKRSKGSARRRNGTICFFGVSMVVTVVAQIMFPFLPLYSVGLLIGTCGMHVFVQEDEKEEFRRSQKETDEIISNANMGVWHIFLFDGEEPRMRANAKMRELLSVPDTMTDETEIYYAWFSRIKPEALESVYASIEEMKKGNRSENTYLWIDPKLGEQYVRCGGVAEYIEDKGWMLRGYHYNVNDEMVRKQQGLKEIAKSNAILEAISQVYHTIYLVDGKTYEMNFIRSSGKSTIRKALDMVVDSADYSESMNSYASSYVYEEDRTQFINSCNIYTVLSEIENNQIYSVDYRRINEAKIISYHQVAFAKVEGFGFSIAFRDIDAMIKEEQEKQQTLADALKAAEAASKAKTTFLNNMSHDIRTPMNAIIGFTALAGENLDDKELLKNYLQKIATSSDHLLSLINDVLDMSRIESGKVRLEEKAYHLPTIINDLKTVLLPDANSKRQNFTVSLIDVVNENVICDKLRLNQVLLNCASNAIKYTPPGGNISIEVIQKPGKKSREACFDFIIRDNGIGMSEEYIGHIFEPFTREETSTVNGIQGTGLGMSITKNIVEMMDGTISVSSKQGEGSVFTITLDFLICDEVSKVSDNSLFGENSTFISSVEEASSSTTNMEKHDSHNSSDAIDYSGKRILLVEDNDLNREIEIAMLSGTNVIIEEAENGQVALEMVRTSEVGYYDLILMDIQMPVLDGYRATLAIRDLDREDAKTVPIVAVSANAFEEDKRKSINVGMNDHVAKPFDQKKIAGILKKYL